MAGKSVLLGLAVGRPWTLYGLAMTTPDDKFSFLGRFSILATIGVILCQLLVCFAGLFSAEIKSKGDAAVILIFFPALSFMAIAVIYYLFKGIPSGADKKLSEGFIIPCWWVSLINAATFVWFRF